MAAIKINVSPSNLAGFGRTAAGECEEANKIGALARLTGADGFWEQGYHEKPCR